MYYFFMDNHLKLPSNLNDNIIVVGIPDVMHYTPLDMVYLRMYSVITQKGQITIPASIRKKLNLKPGTIVSFQLTKQGNKASIQVIPESFTKKELIEHLFGSLKSPKGYISLSKARKILAQELAKEYTQNDKKQ